MINLGGVIMCTGHEDVNGWTFNCVWPVNLDLYVLFDVMFYVVWEIRKIHSLVLLMLCCPLHVITLRVGQSIMMFSP